MKFTELPIHIQETILNAAIPILANSSGPHHFVQQVNTVLSGDYYDPTEEKTDDQTD